MRNKRINYSKNPFYSTSSWLEEEEQRIKKDEQGEQEEVFSEALDKSLRELRYSSFKTPTHSSENKNLNPDSNEKRGSNSPILKRLRQITKASLNAHNKFKTKLKQKLFRRPLSQNPMGVNIVSPSSETFLIPDQRH